MQQNPMTWGNVLSNVLVGGWLALRAVDAYNHWTAGEEERDAASSQHSGSSSQQGFNRRVVQRGPVTFVYTSGGGGLAGAYGLPGDDAANYCQTGPHAGHPIDSITSWYPAQTGLHHESCHIAVFRCQKLPCPTDRSVVLGLWCHLEVMLARSTAVKASSAPANQDAVMPSRRACGPPVVLAASPCDLLRPMAAPPFRVGFRVMLPATRGSNSVFASACISGAVEIFRGEKTMNASHRVEPGLLRMPRPLP